MWKNNSTQSTQKERQHICLCFIGIFKAVFFLWIINVASCDIKKHKHELISYYNMLCHIIFASNTNVWNLPIWWTSKKFIYLKSTISQQTFVFLVTDLAAPTLIISNGKLSRVFCFGFYNFSLFSFMACIEKWETFTFMDIINKTYSDAYAP